MSAYGMMYYVDDMKKAVAFCSKKLGLKARHQSAEWSEFPVSDAHAICLHAKGKGGKGKVKPGGTLILNAKGLKAIHAKLKRGKVAVSALHEVHPGAWSFTLTDPSGNDVSYYGTP